MPKRLNVRASESPFTAILGRHGTATVKDSPSGATPAAASVTEKRGKSADPAYTKLTAYIRKDTHQAVKIRLLQEGQGREFSELVQELLEGWLAPQK